MSFDPHVVLNEELPPKKYESYSAPASNYGDTLDEPVIDTFVTHPTHRSAISNRSTRRSLSPCEAMEITRK